MPADDNMFIRFRKWKNHNRRALKDVEAKRKMRGVPVDAPLALAKVVIVTQLDEQFAKFAELVGGDVAESYFLRVIQFAAQRDGNGGSVPCPRARFGAVVLTRPWHVVGRVTGERVYDALLASRICVLSADVSLDKPDAEIRRDHGGDAAPPPRRHGAAGFPPNFNDDRATTQEEHASASISTDPASIARAPSSDKSTPQSADTSVDTSRPPSPSPSPSDLPPNPPPEGGLDRSLDHAANDDGAAVNGHARPPSDADRAVLDLILTKRCAVYGPSGAPMSPQQDAAWKQRTELRAGRMTADMIRTLLDALEPRYRELAATVRVEARRRAREDRAAARDPSAPEEPADDELSDGA